jgi:hypothetical protein
VINTVKQGTGTAWGIFLDGVDGGLVVNNRITLADIAAEYSMATGKYRDNLTFDVPTPGLPIITTHFVGGTDAGNNN